MDLLHALPKPSSSSSSFVFFIWTSEKNRKLKKMQVPDGLGVRLTNDLTHTQEKEERERDGRRPRQM